MSTWTGCSAFSVGGYFFLNDATCADGAQEYAVVRQLADGRYEQIESITFSWCSPQSGLELIQRVLAGEFDQADYRREVQPRLQTPEQHGRCHLCA
ncbi:MAG: hypothetical protein KF708_07840 [Pirellulales bacterium]|nr:hypothetical protein [Pirellulales bacterium]